MINWEKHYYKIKNELETVCKERLFWQRLYLSHTLLFLLTLAVLLASCAPRPALESFCPPVIAYTKDQQNGVEDELERHPDLHYIPLFLEGYAQTRDALRALTPEIPKKHLWFSAGKIPDPEEAQLLAPAASPAKRQN